MNTVGTHAPSPLARKILVNAETQNPGPIP
jgi:hypothetical protein